MKILIIEDEIRVARNLETMLLHLIPEARVLGIIPTVEEAVRYLEEHTPELLFMDVNLADGVSFSIFEKVQVNVPVIFVTAGNPNHTRIFKKNKVRFLLKPVDERELSKVMKEFLATESRREHFKFDPDWFSTNEPRRRWPDIRGRSIK